MKIGYTNLDLPQTKVKYNNKKEKALIEKCKPKKKAPFYVEFVEDEFVHCDIIAISKDSILDLLILDIEKCENRLERCTDENDKKLLRKCIEYMENENPLCDLEVNEEEHKILKALAPSSYKPVLQITEQLPVNEIIEKALDKANLMFFFTAGPKEVHPWLVKKGSSIIKCAGIIHSDLEKGFIKGDVASFEDFMASHSFNDCKKKGLVKLVDRDHTLQDSDIIEIRFNI